MVLGQPIDMTCICWSQERLNEDVIDYELLEDLIIYIDEEGEVGAVLVFLPVSRICDLRSSLFFFCFYFLVIL